MTDPKIAKLIEQGESQAVILPAGIRLPGDNVEVHREGDQVVLKPVRKIRTKAEIDAVFAEIDRLAQGRFIEGGIERMPMPSGDDLLPFDPPAGE